MWADHSVVLDDVELAWVEQGEGRPVVFLSGGPGDAAGYLQPLAEPLAAECRCIVPDLRGTGLSILRPEAPLTIDALFGDLDQLLVAAGVERVTLVGHSFGATLAILYAAARRHAVGAAVLIGLGPLDAVAAEEARVRLVGALPSDRRSAWAEARRARKEASAIGDTHAFRDAFLAQMEIALPAFVCDVDAGRRLVAQRRAHFDHNPAVHTRLNADLAEIDQWAAVAQLQTPLLVLYGEHDFEPIGQAAAIARLVRAETLVVPGAAHLPWLDQPSAVTSALRSFLGTPSS